MTKKFVKSTKYIFISSKRIDNKTYQHLKKVYKKIAKMNYANNPLYCKQINEDFPIYITCNNNPNLQTSKTYNLDIEYQQFDKDSKKYLNIYIKQADKLDDPYQVVSFDDL